MSELIADAGKNTAHLEVFIQGESRLPWHAGLRSADSPGGMLNN
ncbi:hypothetical protein [Actinacidiphila glaucinigra]